MPAITISELNAHLATPPVGEGPWPGVVLVHDAFGLTDVAREHLGRLAAAGYVAVAPDLYSAGGMRRCVRATFASLLAGRGKAFDDLDAVRRWLSEDERCTGRVGVIGFCMGGGFALLTATRGFDASAPNYPSIPLPKLDVDAAVRGACPIVASYGGRDRMLPGAAAKLEAALERAEVPHDVKEYPDAGHSFLDRFNGGQPATALLRFAGTGYHAPSAEDAWDRILRFFDEHLRAAE